MKGNLVLPRENLFRAVYSCPATDGAKPARAVNASTTGDGRTLELQWCVFDQWTEIDSWYEGNFMERIAPGATKKTIAESASNMRILLQHGRDPSIGEKPIAPIDLVTENDIGGYAEGRLFDGLDPLVVDGIRAGQYGASFRFRVLRDEIDQEPGVSEYNPKGIPERTIKEMGVSEFGPVTWGAYGAATAGVRSITDEIHFGIFRDMPPQKLAELARFWQKGARMDSEDADTLAKMIVLASEYIEEQDEPDDASNIPAMQAIQTQLVALLNVEAAETEPDEPTEGEASAPDHPSDESRRAPAATVEAPANEATPTTERDYLHGDTTPPWHLS